MVDAKLSNVPDSVNIIPFVPPAHLRSEVTFSIPKLTNGLRNVYFRLGVFYSFEQSRPYQISSTYYGLTHIDATPAYTLLNVGIGSDIMNRGKKVCSVYLNVDNVANTSYIDYMSRYKFAVNEINGQEQKYVYNMGRNISAKVIVPLDFKRRK
jgi:iron complex outermembrane receptor protein